MADAGTLAPPGVKSSRGQLFSVTRRGWEGCLGTLPPHFDSDGCEKTANPKLGFSNVSGILSHFAKCDEFFANAAAAMIRRVPTLPDVAAVGYASEVSDSLEWSASRAAIAREVRSRSTIAAITPHTTAMTSAIHENRVSQRSAATPA